MPLRVHPEDASWEFRGVPQVDALRLRVKNPVADYWTFDHLNPDYLVQSSGAADFAPAGDFTVMARVRLDVTPNDHVLINKAVFIGGPANPYEWELYFNSSGDLVARVSLDGTTWLSTTVAFTYSGPHELLVALTYDVATETVAGFVVDSGGTLTNTATSGGTGSPVNNNAATPIQICARSDLSGNEWPDRIYWWGFVESKLTGANLQAIFDNQDVHPMDFDLLAYDDFNDTVAATHTTLIGSYNFTVTGSPTHTGDQGPSWPDPTRTFEPARYTGDFTVVGAFIPDQAVPVVDSGIVSKWNEDGVNQRIWRIRQNGAGVSFAVSKDGTVAGMTEVTVAAVLTDGEIARFAMRYEDKGDGSSDLICEVNGTEASSSTAVAPVFKSNAADLQVAGYDAATAKHLDGKMLWWGYFNRKLTNTEKDNLLSYFVRPVQMPGMMFYDDFHQAVAAEKDSTFPELGVHNPYPWKGPMVFDVDGAPIQAGVTESSWDDYRLGPVSDVIEHLEFIQHLLSLSTALERVYPRASYKEVSTPGSIPDLETESQRLLSVHPIPTREYPRASKKELGPIVSPLRIKPRAGG